MRRSSALMNLISPSALDTPRCFRHTYIPKFAFRSCRGRRYIAQKSQRPDNLIARFCVPHVYVCVLARLCASVYVWKGISKTIF